MAGSTMLTSCMDGDWDVPTSIQHQPPYGNNQISIAENPTSILSLKRLYANHIENNSSIQITEDIQLQVIINGNDEGGNFYKQISVQDQTGGIIVGINSSELFSYLPIGQKILINLKGLYIGAYGKQAQIGTLYNGSIGRMELADWKAHMRLVPASAFEAKIDTLDFNPGEDQIGRVVRIADAAIAGEGTQTLAPNDGSVKLVSNYANRTINGNKKTILRTSVYSKFAALAIPTGKADIYGICTRFNDTAQILMRTESDLQTK